MNFEGTHSDHSIYLHFISVFVSEYGVFLDVTFSYAKIDNCSHSHK